MTDLVLAADAAYPFDYGTLPAGVRVILGYVGGVTPHAWTREEIAAAESTGRQWWPIWTAPNPAATIGAATGTRDGNAMVAALVARGINDGRPAFYDIEQSTYVAQPTGARKAWAAWESVLHTAGHPDAFPYVPWAAGTGWVAKWQTQTPTALPTGDIGWQFEGNAHNGLFDLSVFAPQLVEDETMPTAKDIWEYKIPNGNAAFRKKYGYTTPAPQAKSLLLDASRQGRANAQQLAAVQAAITKLAKAPAGSVDAAAIVKALAVALTSGTK